MHDYGAGDIAQGKGGAPIHETTQRIEENAKEYSPGDEKARAIDPCGARF